MSSGGSDDEGYEGRRMARSASGSSAGLASEHSGDTHSENGDTFDPDIDSTSHTDVSPAAGGGGDAMSALLASYYGLAAQAPVKKELEIDASEFDADAYVRRMFQVETLEGLLNRDDELVQEVKRLDSDMQMLVYENYSKFISATDTIRKMKNNVNDMKSEMDSLVKNMEGISTRMQSINSFLSGKRAKVDKLVAVRRLIKRLEFLFDLPINLNRYIQRGDYTKAVVCYQKCITILRQHANVPSFKAIQRESDQIIGSLKDEMQKKMQEVDSVPSQVTQYVDLLQQLGIPKAELQSTVLRAYKSRFTKILHTQQQVEEQQLKSLVESGAAEADFGPYMEGCVTRLDGGFLKDFEEAIGVYSTMFLESNGAGGVKQTPAYMELLDTSKHLFRQYLDIITQLLKYDLTLISTNLKRDCSRNPTCSPLGALRLLLQSTKRVHVVLKDANLMELSVRLVKEVVQSLIFLEFRGLQHLGIKKLVGLYSIVPKTRPGEEGLEAFAPLFPFREHVDRTVDDVAVEVGKVLEALQPTIRLADEAHNCLGGTRGRGSSNDNHTSSSSSPANMGIQHYLWQYLCWFTDAMERLVGVTYRLSESDVIDLGEFKGVERRRIFPERYFSYSTSFTTLLDSESEPPVAFPTINPGPQYILLLAVLAREVLVQLSQRASVQLEKNFPNSLSSTMGTSGLNKLSTEEMKNCLQGCASRLLQHYVETLGTELVRLILQGVGAGTEAKGEVDKLTWSKALLLRLDTLVRELASALVLGARKGVHVDIERIFTVKVQVFGQVEFTVDSILQAVIKVAFKALIEAVRHTTLTPRSYLQLQVDVQVLRQAVSAFLKDSGVAENLLEEALISAGERCLEPPQSLDISPISSVVTSELNKLINSLPRR